MTLMLIPEKRTTIDKELDALSCGHPRVIY